MRYVLVIFLLTAGGSDHRAVTVDMSTEKTCEQARKRFLEDARHAAGVTVIASCLDRGSAY